MNKIKKELKENSILYEENFKNMMKSVGADEHRKYKKREEFLEKRCIKLQKLAGTYLEDPCRFRLNISCFQCFPSNRKGGSCHINEHIKKGGYKWLS